MKPRLTVHPLAPKELVADMNLQLQRDEGSHVMPQDEAIRRLSQWLAGDYVCHLYRFDQRLAGYVLYRPTDPDAEGHLTGFTSVSSSSCWNFADKGWAGRLSSY